MDCGALIAAEEKGKKEMRATCKDDLQESKIRNNNCPIVLEKLTFNVFSHYMSTKKSKKSGGYVYANIYGGVQIYLIHLYRMSDKTMDRGFEKELSQFMLGIINVVVANNRLSSTNILDGNRAMIFEVYTIVCEELYDKEINNHLFAHALQTMGCNLMARSYNCVNMHVQYIQWRSDSLI